MNYGTNKKEVISFRKTIAPNTTEILQERIKSDGTIEGVRIRFYSGQQLALRVNPYVEHKGRKYENLLTYAEGTSTFLSGDDDRFDYPTVLNVDYDDFLKVWVQNTDLVNAYDVVVDITIDYYGGQNRVV